MYHTEVVGGKQHRFYKRDESPWFVTTNASGKWYISSFVPRFLPVGPFEREEDAIKNLKELEDGYYQA